MDFFIERDQWLIPTKVNPMNSEIIRAFDDATIFITGATGFIGKLVMEALLRKIKTIKKIYVLVREKKGKTPKERLDDEFNDRVFSRLKKVCGSNISKVDLMIGDINQPNCGLTNEDIEKIKREVNYVFHIAATLRFNEHLTSAFQSNVRTTRFLIETASQATNLKAFVDVSTAYSHACKPDISEKFYDMPYSTSDMEKLIETSSFHQMSFISPLILGPWNNSYAFTKALSEEVVKEYIGRIPICIVRPSIVIGCDEEPLTGWINNVYGATGVAVAAGLGLMRTWYGGQDKKADIIPADKVVNTILAAAYETFVNHQNGTPMKVPVYNAVSSPENPLTWGDYMRYLQEVRTVDNMASVKSVGPYYFSLESKKWIYKVKIYTLQLIPALLVDLFLKIKGKPPMLFNAYIKIHNFNMMLKFYAEREWNYDQQNVVRLWDRLPPTDQTLFPFAMSKLRWDIHLLSSMRAMRLYILNDPFETLEASRVHDDRFELVMIGVKALFYFSIAYLIKSILI